VDAANVALGGTGGVGAAGRGDAARQVRVFPHGCLHVAEGSAWMRLPARG